MKLEITRSDVWAATVEDRPAGAGEKLAALAAAGANLEFVIGRRAAEQPGKGVVFVTPLKGPAQLKAGKAAGFKKADSLHSVRIEGPDKAGLGAALTTALADAGINLSGISAAAVGKKFVAYLAVDSIADVAKAVRVLKKLG